MKLRITISKYHLWYLCQISLQIMLLPIQTRSDLKISRSSPVSFREIAETSRKVTNLHAQSCPETSASFHNYFSYPELPWVAVAQLANPST